MTRVMGIVNVTPDSFSDGGRYFDPDEAVRRARNMLGEGVDIIDLGGESTRPGATPLDWEEEWSRIEPVFGRLEEERAVCEGRVPLSVDTYHPETAERAVARGARIVNCVSSEPVAEMLRIARGRGDVEVVVPCRLDGADDPCARFGDFPRERLYLDPMIGFGTTREEDLALLQSVPRLAAFGRVLVGASRKRIVKKLTGEKVTGKDLAGNLALAVWCALNGASVVRVHDVAETARALRVVSALGEADAGKAVNR